MAVPLTAGTAQAESCTSLPGATPGATIEVGERSFRVPSISGIAVCIEPAGLPGIPWVSTEGCGPPCASVIVTGSSGASGYVVVRFSTDGAPQEVRAPIPGSGGGAETCYAGVGVPARADCLVKISLDNLPTVPPVTVPPVSPEPLPTVSPEPICLRRPPICVPPGEIDVIETLRWACAQVPPAILECAF